MNATNFDPAHEPPIGSVVAIDWGQHRQEVWVSNQANVGNWYTADIPWDGRWHPQWSDVVERARGRTLTMLAAGDADSWRAGWHAGASAVEQAVLNADDEAKYRAPKMGDREKGKR